jgi:hypothetical protein
MEDKHYTHTHFKPVLDDIRRLLTFFLILPSLMFTGYGTKKQTTFQSQDWTWTKAAGRSGKKARLAPQNFFTTLGTLSE